MRPVLLALLVAIGWVGVAQLRDAGYGDGEIAEIVGADAVVC